MTKLDPAEALYAVRRATHRALRCIGWFLVVCGIFVPIARRLEALHQPHLAEFIAQENSQTDPILLSGVVMGIMLLFAIRRLEALAEHDRKHGRGPWWTRPK